MQIWPVIGKDVIDDVAANSVSHDHKLLIMFALPPPGVSTVQVGQNGREDGTRSLWRSALTEINENVAEKESEFLVGENEVSPSLDTRLRLC